MRVYAVGEIGEYVQALLAADEILADVWIAGEVTNFSRSSAGHLYFALKDDAGQLRTVMWRSYALRCGADPRPGDAVVVHGRFDFYPPHGSLQLVADLLYPAGVGDGQLRFESLRLRLEEEGLFAPERKRPLPAFPRRIGLITSETGAVYHDVVTVLGRRFPLCQVVFCHSAVQGERAPAELLTALKRLEQWRDGDGSPVDLVIVARGGGSPEELACFNDERLARAIFAAPWPVVSAIGHETDYTICDLVADHRAPTPSAAAELVSPDLAVLRQELTDLVLRSRACVEQVLAATRADLGHTRDRLVAHSPLAEIARRRQATTDQLTRALLGLEGRLRTLREQLGGRRLQLAALSPRATLARGYAIVTSSDGEVVRSRETVRPGERLAIAVADGTIDAVTTAEQPASAPTSSNGADTVTSPGR